MAESLRPFQSTLGFYDASAFSSHSAVKLEYIAISQIKNGRLLAHAHLI